MIPNLMQYSVGGNGDVTSNSGSSSGNGEIIVNVGQCCFGGNGEITQKI